jgi:hypothetical protein
MAKQFANVEEKLRYYRSAAEEAKRNAERAKDEDTRNAYLAIERTWIYLAEELERETALADSGVSVTDQTDEVFVPSPSGDRAHKSR